MNNLNDLNDLNDLQTEQEDYPYRYDTSIDEAERDFWIGASLSYDDDVPDGSIPF